MISSASRAEGSGGFLLLVLLADFWRGPRSRVSRRQANFRYSIVGIAIPLKVDVYENSFIVEWNLRQAMQLIFRQSVRTPNGGPKPKYRRG